MKKPQKVLNILLADDDPDDRYFFDKILKELSMPTKLSVVEDGVKLMAYLLNRKILPDILFLDINMPRKNGMECLAEIKSNEHLKNIVVIIHSTSLHDDVSNIAYESGAHYFIKKNDYIKLVPILQRVITSLMNTDFIRPPKSEFAIH